MSAPEESDQNRTILVYSPDATGNASCRGQYVSSKYIGARCRMPDCRLVRVSYRWMRIDDNYYEYVKDIAAVLCPSHQAIPKAL